MDLAGFGDFEAFHVDLGYEVLVEVEAEVFSFHQVLHVAKNLLLRWDGEHDAFDGGVNVDVPHFLVNVFAHTGSVDEDFLDALEFVADDFDDADYCGVGSLEREANYAYELGSLFLGVPANYDYDGVVDFLAEVNAHEVL